MPYDVCLEVCFIDRSEVLTAFVSRRSDFGSSIVSLEISISGKTQGITGHRGLKKSLKSKISASFFAAFFQIFS